ncbi:stage II sporulation protein D [Paenibacillus sp. M1]|uniref:Stage II sporulation protein D n=1 Tax=Paenibacillus haidiansis TaxID=1574488 RepID=A0ABU7VYP5_9BACL
MNDKNHRITVKIGMGVRDTEAGNIGEAGAGNAGPVGGGVCIESRGSTGAGGAGARPMPGPHGAAPNGAAPLRAGQPAPASAREPAPQPLRLRLAPGARTRPSSFRGGGRRGWALAAALAGLAALAVLLPALLAGRSTGPQPPAAPAAQTAPGQGPAAGAAVAAGGERLEPAEASPADEPEVRVYLTRTGSVETVPLEQYVTGVLAAEMPADFELEALKAQAIAARTFIIRRLAAGDTSGVPGRQADVVDTVDHQAYLSKETLERWAGSGKSEQLAKLEQAVRETRGIVMTYQGKPITAAFFSSSGGYTENSEEYWSLRIPYLRSVPSPWDSTVNPHNKETVTLSVNELFERLGQKAPAQTALAGASGSGLSDSLVKILSFTSGKRVKGIRIGDQTYTGREIREKLDLRSSQFSVKLDGTNVKITTYGYGHGVGMSQWGANGMAQKGYTTTQILKHYYTGISFQQTSNLLKRSS